MNQSQKRTKLLLLVGVIIFLIVVVVSFIQYKVPLKSFEAEGRQYTGYNNYIIFKQSFYHLKDGKDLYQLYSSEHWDYYKYSPSFAVLFAPFVVLPDLAGLILWNMLNALTLLLGLFLLFKGSPKTFVLATAFVVVELITSTQNSQSNALMVGMIMIAFYCLKQRRVGLAVLLILLTAFIKINGLVALGLFVFYPQRLKAMTWVFVWTILLAALPLLAVPLDHLAFLYKSWANLLEADHGASYGLSVMGWLNSWFNAGVSKESVLLVGTALLLFPLIGFRHYSNELFRRLFLASVLIYMVIFNHKAESATFIIAVTGVAIWYFSQPGSAINIILLILVFIFTVLSPTDAFPATWRRDYIVPYVLKAVPCILVWLKIVAEMIWFGRVARRNKPAQGDEAGQ